MNLDDCYGHFEKYLNVGYNHRFKVHSTTHPPAKQTLRRYGFDVDADIDDDAAIDVDVDLDEMRW